MNWYSIRDFDNAPFPEDRLFNTGLSVALFEPEIAPNAGNVSRMCFGSNVKLHIVGKPGFEMKNDKHFRRAAVDYWDRLDIKYHADFAAFEKWAAENAPPDRPPRMVLATTNGKKPYYDFDFEPYDYLVFGKESAGLPKDVVAKYEATTIRIPLTKDVRCLNLSTSCGIITYHAIVAVNRKLGLIV